MCDEIYAASLCPQPKLWSSAVKMEKKHYSLQMAASYLHACSILFSLKLPALICCVWLCAAKVSHDSSQEFLVSVSQCDKSH